jgi:acyl carrier protein
MGLDTVEFVLWAEKEFGLEIPDEDASGILTVGEFCRYVSGRCAVKEGFVAPSYQSIFDLVAHQLSEEYKVSRHLITEQARFVKDLGLD